MAKKNNGIQDILIVIYLIWSVIAVSGILFLDKQLYFLGLALLIMVIVFSTIVSIVYGSLTSALMASIIYGTVFFSIFKFTTKNIYIPGFMALIFFITAFLGKLVMQKISKTYQKMQTEIQILSNLIQYDADTNLLLWQYVRKKIDDELTRSLRYKKNFSLIMTGTVHRPSGILDDEKEQIIRQGLADLLSRSCRKDIDIPFGGNHYGIILPETDSIGAFLFSKRLMQEASRKIAIDLRIGIVSYPTDAGTTESLIEACEEALQTALTTENSIVRYGDIHKI